MEQQPRSQLLTLPGAIIVAGAIIAIAIIWTQKPVIVSTAQAPSPAKAEDISLAPITAADHILGDPKAPVKIVEYSDPSCPFCKQFNPTMTEIMDQYGPSGKVAWVYRAFPLDKPGTRPDGGTLHPNAGHESQALECANSLGGNTAFWKYEKQWYSDFPLQGATDRSVADDTAQLVQIAKTVGLDQAAFNDCLSSGRFKDAVEKQYVSGLNAGVSGTPYSVLVTPSGNKIPIIGAQTYATVKASVDALLANP